MSIEIILLILVLVAGFYMSWNIGANDVANAMGTSVGSGALTLKQAVIIAAVLEFSGAFFFGSHVSSTIQTGIVDPEIFAHDSRILVYGMLSSLIAAGAWLQVVSYFGWPVSTTHSIIGALIGFGVVVGGIEAVYWSNVFSIVSSWIVSPLLGGLISYGVFSLLRKQIFYSSCPLKAAKKWTPLLVFLLILILFLIMIPSGLKNLNLSPLQGLFMSLVAGGIGAFISWLCLKRLFPTEVQIRSVAQINLEQIKEMEKAKKCLERVQSASCGELQFHLENVVEEIDGMIHKQSEPHDDAHSEYSGVEKIFGYLQIISACLMAFAHGANDVANAIGPLSASASILLTGEIPFEAPVPAWALALGGVGIVAGLATWGWRVIETIGKKITELTPTRGFAAEFGAATTILLASRLGLPISTTHTLVGAVIGVGLARGIEALDLGTMREIVISWVVTVPAGAAVAVAVFYLIAGIFG